MTNALQPDAQKTPESTSLPSLPVDHHTTDRSHLDLNSDLDVNDPGLQEVTSQHVTTPDATAALPLPQAEPTLKLLDPKKISIAEMPNRTPEAYEDEAFESLCQSMVAQHGNTQPIQVRLLTPAEIFKTPGFTHMLISGERRNRAAEATGQLVQAIVFEGPMCFDTHVMALTENLSRKDLSPYEWGRQLKYLSQQNVRYSLSRLAQLSGRDKSVVSRAVELASLPDEIVAAFTSVRDLRYSDAKPLREAFEKAPENVLVEALLIKEQGEKLKGPAVVKRLVEAASGGIAPCNTSEPIAIKFEEKVIGELTKTKNGGAQITIDQELSYKQRLALAGQIEQFVTRRVLRTLAPGPDKPKSKPEAKATTALLTLPQMRGES